MRSGSEGLLLASLRRLGERHAIIGGSFVFGVLHLSNFFTGRPPLYLALQFAFAVGLALAELLAATRSLWLGIVWHVGCDLAALTTGDQLTPAVLAGLALMTALLAVTPSGCGANFPPQDLH